MKINKVINIGKMRPEWAKRGYQVFCKIKFDGERLSITGVEGPLASGNCRGSCGQIRPVKNIIELADGWTHEMRHKFNSVWKEWHLNDMNAGTPRQSAIIDEYKANNPEWRYDYAEACEILEKAGCLCDDQADGYKYGTAWLHRDVPQDVLEFLDSLPASTITPAWV